MIDASASSITAQEKRHKLRSAAVNCSGIKKGTNALWATAVIVLDPLAFLVEYYSNGFCKYFFQSHTLTGEIQLILISV